VSRTVSLDGEKWIRDDGAWLLVRMSGTEPMVRVYAEAGSDSEVVALLAAGEALLV
jgi:phosphomannomutase